MKASFIGKKFKSEIRKGEPLLMVSVDLDSTLYNTQHRWHLIDRVNGTDWEAYSARHVDDTPGPAFAVGKALTELEVPWVVVSGRSESARETTRKQLYDDGLRPWGIYLCDERHNHMPHGKWKALRLLEIQKELNCRFILHVDDIGDVAIETEKIGIPTVLAHEVGAIPDHLG